MNLNFRSLSLYAALAAVLAAGPALASSDYFYHYKYSGPSGKGYYGYDKNNAQGDNYKAAHEDYEKDVAAYNTAYAEWSQRKTAYQNYQTAKAAYDKRYAEYLKNKQSWESSTGSGGVGAVIDRDSYVEGHEDRKIVNKLEEAVEVPQFSNISEYRQYCQEYVCTNKTRGGTLECLNMYHDDSGEHQISFTFTDTIRDEYWSSGESKIGFVFFERDQLMFKAEIKQEVKITRTVAQQHISGGYAGAVYPFVEKIEGISDTCEKNSVVLIGTQHYPIRLNGPVYVDGDVIIRGFVTGQGSIYSARNIHIIGDISYFDPPSWPHSTEDLRKPENAPAKVKQANAGKDMLLLAARGNIIVGDYTSVEWTNATQMAYLDLTKSGRALKSFSTSESDIGYSAGYPANKSYVSADGGKTMGMYVTTDGPNKTGWLEGSGAGIIGGGIRAYYIKHIEPKYTLIDRKYYESSLGAMAIQQLKQTSVDVNAKPTWRTSSTLLRRIFAAIGWYEDNPTIADNTDSGDVTEIDAILYANHGIFGVAGGVTDNRLHLNGAMICRDEGLLTSFAERFKNNSSARAWINWDMRIKSDLEGSAHIGAPEQNSTSKGIGIKRVTWSYRR